MSFAFLLFPDTRLIVSQVGVTLTRNIRQVEVQRIGGGLKRVYTKYDAIIEKAFRGNKEAYEYDVILNKLPVDLRAYDITAQARVTDKAAATLFDLVLLDGINGNDFEHGIVILVLAKEITEILPSVCEFEIKAVHQVNEDDVFTIAYGEIHTHEKINQA